MSNHTNTTTAAVLQMVSNQDVDVNLERAATLIQQAADQHATLIVLPEMFACLGVKNQREIAARMTESDVLGTLSDLAKNTNACIIAGSVPFITPDCAEDKVKASSFVFAADGSILARYDKIHLFDVDVADNKGSYRESDTFSPGNAGTVLDVHQRKLGLSICYDLRFPELYQHYQQMGCHLISAPSAFTYRTGEAHWETLIKARAIETQCFVLAANQGGTHEDGRQTWGHSMIVNPWGEVLAEVKTSGEGIAVAQLDFDELESVRRNMPISKHKRLR